MINFFKVIIVELIMSGKQLNKNRKKSNIKKIPAFTLAEVLITLGIIGVVAALTIPTLMNNAQNQGFVSGMKKGFSILSQANSALIAESGSITSAVISYGNLTNALKAQLKIMKYCPANQNPGECFSSTFINLAGNPAPEVLDYYGQAPNEYNRMALADGSSIIVADSSDCQWDFGGLATPICGVVVLDVNGLKKPNQLGRDIYYFIFSSDNVVHPIGALGYWDANGDDAHKDWSDWWAYCNPNFYEDGVVGGWACAGRILKDGGMKY